MLKKLAHFFDIRQSPIVLHVRKHGAKRVAPITFLASVTLVGAVLLAQNGKTPQQPQEQNAPVIPATPAQPFPGEGIPAIPAIPAIPPKPVPPPPQKPNTDKEFIFIMSPYGGKGWVRGSADRTSSPYKGMNIVWVWISQKPGEIQFEINLLKGGSFYRKIASYRAQSDAWLAQTWWEIPQDIPEGSDYTIEVREERRHKFRAVNGKPFAILGENITVGGRLIDLFSKKPLSSVEYRSIEGNQIKTDSEGRFTFSGKTDPPPKAYTGIQYSPSCYMTEGLSGYYNVSYGDVVWGSPPEFPQFQLYMYNGNSYDLLRFSPIEPDLKMYPILTTNLDLGDVLVRPSGSPYVFSDIPIRFEMDFADSANQPEGGGNASYSRTNGVSNYFPLEYDTRIVLIDEAGTKYTSPWHKAGVENRCKSIVLSFLNKEFQWQSYEIAFTTGGYGGAGVGRPFSLSLTAEGGTAPYTFSIIYGTLPPGLSLDSATGQISGTATAAGYYDILVKVTDQKGVSNGRRFPITVSP